MPIIQTHPVNVVVARLVRQELAASVERCAAWLEQCVGDAQPESATLEALENAIDQLRGAMAILQLDGGCLLAESLRSACHRLPACEGRARKRLAGQISQGLLALPLFFDHVLRTAEEVPALLLPLANDIRGEARQPLCPETRFATDTFMDLPLPAAGTTGQPDPERLQADLPRLRHMFNTGLLGLLRQRHQRISLRLMHRAASQLCQLLAGTPMGTQWHYARALLEASLQPGLENTVSRRYLWVRLEHRLRRLARAPEVASQEAADPGWLRECLYLVALSGARGGEAGNLLQAAGLADGGAWTDARLVQERRRMFGKTADTIDSMARELGLEMGQAKRIVERLAAGENSSADLMALAAQLKRIADAVQMAGLPEAADVLWAMLHQLKGWHDQQVPPGPADILALADTLLFVESRFAGIAGLAPLAAAPDQPEQLFLTSRRQLLDAQQIVIRECLLNLQRSKAAVGDYIDNAFDESRLGDLAGILRQVRGGLVMLELARPAVVLAAAIHFVEALVAEQVAASELPRRLEALADVIITIEHALEQYEISRQVDDALMQVAENGLESLGYKTARTPSPESPPS